MDFKQLRALLAVAETGSVTRAATLLHIVQPAVSRQIRLLEESFGAPLFERERHGMELTDAGRILADYARRALRELEQARAEIQPASGAVSGLVNVGLLPSVCDLVAGELVAGLQREHPQIRLRLTIGYAGHLQQWLEQGEVDLAMLYNLRPSPVLEAEALLDERLYLVGLPASSLKMNRPQPLSSLQGRPLILPSAPHGIRSVVEHACAQAGVTLEITAEANAMNLQKVLVQHGLGFTILPSAAIFDDVERGTLAAAPIARPDLRRRVVLALPAGRRVPAAVRCVASALAQQVRACVQAGRWPGARLHARG